MNKRLTLAALLTTAAFAPAAFAQDIETADGEPLIAECEEMLTFVEENDTQGTGMTSERARTIARANQAQYCEDGLRLAQGEISEDETAQNYDAEAAARLLVAVPEPEVMVEQTAPDVTVEQQPPQVTVDPGQPTVTVEQAEPTVRVQMQPPQITIDMPKPRILVEMPDPSVDVAMQEPRVTIEQDEPQVRVEQGEPEIRMGQSDVQTDQGEPQVQVEQEQATVQLQQAEDAQVQVSEVRPNVQYRAAEPRIEVEEGGDPQIAFNQPGEADVQFRQMSAEETQQRADEAQQLQAQAQQQTGEPTEQQQAEGTLQPQGEQQQAEGSMSMVEPSTNLTESAAAETTSVSIERLLDMQVVGANGDAIGDVEDVLFRGEEPFVIVGQGGFLGLGEEQVALPLSDMRLSGEDELLMRELTEEEAEAADMADFQPAEAGREVEIGMQ